MHSSFQKNHNTYTHIHTHAHADAPTYRGNPATGFFYTWGGCERKYNAHFTYLPLYTRWQFVRVLQAHVLLQAVLARCFHYVLRLLAPRLALFVTCGFKAVSELWLSH